MYDRKTREMVQSFRESLYGPGVFTREDDCLHKDGVPVRELTDFPIDRRDDELFSDDAFQEQILNKVVREKGLPAGSLTDEEFIEHVASKSIEPGVVPDS